MFFFCTYSVIKELWWSFYSPTRSSANISTKAHCFSIKKGKKYNISVFGSGSSDVVSHLSEPASVTKKRFLVAVARVIEITIGQNYDIIKFLRIKFTTEQNYKLIITMIWNHKILSDLNYEYSNQDCIKLQWLVKKFAQNYDWFKLWLIRFTLSN